MATAFLFGAMLGSLANVLIHRVPRGQSIVAPPSYCPACGGRITAPDNIPILSFLLLVAAWTDLEHRTIPNAVTYPGTVLGLVCSTVVGDGVSAVVGALAAAAVFLAVAVISRGGVGGGDVKLAAAIGAFLGGPAAFVALFLAVSFGAGAGIVLIALGLRTRRQTIPFGPALAAGALAAVFASNDLARIAHL